ncbi:MAG: GNAT family N-acetyltransferase [Gammaproteobacteria bacterium]|nr:GNAT family N-acetyltransferase [Gammaproteobacteria bacterium]
MSKQPTINTLRLILRPFNMEDSTRIQNLVGAREISDVTANIPYPYLDGMAEEWIATHTEGWNKRESVTFAIVLIETKQLIGCMSLTAMNTEQPELGYWLGVDYWGNGYCTEACKAIIQFGFNKLGLTKIVGKHLSRNPASGKVMIKSGLSYIQTSHEKVGLMKQAEEFKGYEIQCN